MTPADIARQLAGESARIALITERADGRATYAVSTERGERYALKLFADDPNAYHTEKGTLGQLAKYDAPVPAIHSSLDDPAALLLSWAGDETLDQVICRDRTDPLIGRALRSLVTVELIFAEISGSRSEADDLIDSHLKERDQGQLGDLAKVCRQINPDLYEAEELLEALYEIVSQGTWNYGSLDCSAFNIVTDGETVTVTDFSTLGAEWVERRIVSYLIATGARGAGNRYVSAITTGVVVTLIELFGYLGGSNYRPEFIGIHRFLALLTVLGQLFDQQRAGQAGLGERIESLMEALADPVAQPDELIHLVHELGLDRR